MCYLKKLVLFIPLIFLLGSGQAAAEGKTIGFVAAVRGRVVAVSSATGERCLAVKDKIFLADTIKTGSRGRIQLVFDDNTIVSLGRDSELNIAEYEWNSKQNKGKITTGITKGIFRIMGGAIARTTPEKFKTITPSATIGIRGSMYAGQIRNKQLSVVFLGGRGIEVSNLAGAVIITTPGFGTRIKSISLPPEEPSQFSKDDIDEINPEVEAAPDDEAGSGNRDELPADENYSENNPDNQNNEGEIDNIITGIQQTTAEISNDSEQDTINENLDIVQQPVPAPEPSPPPEDDQNHDVQAVTMQGTHIAVLLDGMNPENSRVWQGSATALSTPNVTGTAATVAGQADSTAFTVNGTAGTKTFTWENSGSAYNSSLSYNGEIQENNQSRVVSDLLTPGQDETFTNMELYYDLPGVFNGTMLVANSFFEAKFLGVPAPPTPPTDVLGYNGHCLGGYVDYGHNPAAIDAFALDQVYFEANFHNNTVVGMLANQQYPPELTDEVYQVYFMGRLNGSQLTDVRFLGSGGTPFNKNYVSNIIAWDVSASGQFYGPDYHGFSMVGDGHFYDVQSSQSSPSADVYLALGGELDNHFISVVDPAPQGNLSFSGFVTGIADDMTAPDQNRRLFVSSAPCDFVFTVNQDNGVISGSLNAWDLTNDVNVLSDIEIGGAFDSAYAMHDWFVAGLGCTTGSCVQTEDSHGGLKGYGNFLATADLSAENQISDHVSWGYWEISYDDPRNGHPYHLHVPSSLWVAGQQTPEDDIKGLISSNFVGVYNGQARGVHLDGTNVMHELPAGVTALNIDFASAAPVSGSINFPGVVNLAVDSSCSSLTTGGFSAAFQGATGNGLQGAFFGPDAAAVGGNFDAVQGPDRYLGIFLGDR